MTLVESSVATPPSRSFAAALARAARGERLDVDDAEALLLATGPDAESVRRLAADVRDEGLAAAGRPGVITYSRKVFIPLTTLCRDRCHYCIFVDTPGQLLKLHKPMFMSAEQVLAVARQGAALGCKEALLTLGDRPEERWPQARAWLDEHGYTSTLDYVADMARLITAETGLLAHLNPGVMSYDELATLRPTAPSMGMMLETTSRRLFEEPGQVHYGSPDKDPDIRLAVIEDAGRLRIPFTTGILVGIGETVRDRAESLVALREAHARHGHVQEVIVQNFRAKPRTAMQDAPDASLHEYVAAVAVARLVLGPHMRIQVPPNLSDPAEFDLLVRAGADDWGGVSPLTADHVNPERPWPHLDDLAARTAALGYALRERLTAHPRYILDDAEWLDPAIAPATLALADPDTGLARDVEPARQPRLQNSSDSAGGTPLGADPVPAGSDRMSSAHRASAPLLKRAAADPASLDDDDWEALLRATGTDLDALTGTADDVRRYTVGEAVSQVVNRNVASSAFRSRPGAHGSLARSAEPRGAWAHEPGTFGPDELAAIAADAWDLGATELCAQGLLPATEDPAEYLEIARIVKVAVPRMHLHAFRPADVADLADRGGLGLEAAVAALIEAGVDTVPGTGVKVLSERVRALVAPADLEIDRWVEVITTAHRAGLRSTSVLFYGHIETARERIEHLRRLHAIQADTGGFTEFVPIPLPSHGAPLVEGRSPIDEHRAMFAVSRLMLSGAIPHIQVPWTRVGREHAATLLRSGADDLGGTLLDGRVRPEVGAEVGLELPLADGARIARGLFRPFRQRTTDYREPAADQKAELR